MVQSADWNINVFPPKIQFIRHIFKYKMDFRPGVYQYSIAATILVLKLDYSRW